MKASVNESVLRQVKRAKTRRGKKFLEERAPKLIENPKTILVLRAQSSNQRMHMCLRDIAKLRRAQCTFLDRKRPLLPFDDILPLERLAAKSDSNLFVVGSHTKKRPHNLVIGRLYNGHLLDMIELGIVDGAWNTINSFPGLKCSSGIKPCIIFAGERFSSMDPVYERLKGILLELFGGIKIEQLVLTGVEHAIMFVDTGACIEMRSYLISQTSDSSSCGPAAALREIGPSARLTVRRTHLASSDFYRRVTRQPKQLKAKKIANVSRSGLGDKLGRVHLSKQNISSGIRLKRMKAFKSKFNPSVADDDE